MYYFIIYFCREKDLSFYVLDLEDNDEKEIPKITIKELLTLKEDYLEVLHI